MVRTHRSPAHRCPRVFARAFGAFALLLAFALSWLVVPAAAAA